MHGRERVAWNLRRLRVERGVTQEALSFDAGVDRGYVSGIERQTFNPTVDLLDRLAAALHVDVAEFLLRPADGEATPKALRAGRKPGK